MDYPHIVKTPGTCCGFPRIDGTRISVNLIVGATESGMTPAAIHEAHPHVTLAQIHSALAYYYDHREEVDAVRAESKRIEQELRARFPSKLEALRAAAARPQTK